MKNVSKSLFVLSIFGGLSGMDLTKQLLLPTSGGPMNEEWFYHPQNPCKREINLHKKCRWESAELAYELCLEREKLSGYDKHNALLNWASCSMALGKASEGWASFDQMIDIPEE